MGIFGKSRKEKEAEKEAARKKVLDAFDKKHEDALQVRDPADRILRLEDQKVAIDTFITAANGKTVDEAKGKFLMGYLGGTIGSNIAIDAVTFLLFGVPASILVLIPSMIIGLMTGQKRVVKSLEQQIKDNEPFFNQLRERQDKADKAIDAALETDMRDLAESPKFQEALQRTPRLRDKFADAYKRHVIEGGLSGDKNDPKKKPPGFNV